MSYKTQADYIVMYAAGTIYQGGPCLKPGVHSLPQNCDGVKWVRI